jgi:hypothetical protein
VQAEHLNPDAGPSSVPQLPVSRGPYMLDDLECPSCQVLLPDGARTCVKCGRKVEPAKTHLAFIDFPLAIYARLVQRLGPVGAGIVAAAVFLILFVIVIGWALIKSNLAR